MGLQHIPQSELQYQPQATAVIALIMATGFTVMVIAKGVPLQPPALGVTV